jgi:hypothetical protein
MITCFCHFIEWDSSAGLKNIAAGHMSQGSGIVGPETGNAPNGLIEGRLRPNKSEHGLRSTTARHSTSTQMQRHEPSRDNTLAAFACVRPQSFRSRGSNPARPPPLVFQIGSQ